MSYIANNSGILRIRLLHCSGLEPDGKEEFFSDQDLEKLAIPRAKEIVEQYGKEMRETVLIEAIPFGSNSKPMVVWRWDPPQEDESS